MKKAATIYQPGLQFVIGFSVTESAIASETPRVDAAFHVDGDAVVGTGSDVDDVNVLQNFAGNLAEKKRLKCKLLFVLNRCPVRSATNVKTEYQHKPGHYL